MTHFNKFALRVAPVAASVLGVYYLVDTFKLTRSSVKSNYVGRSQVLGSQLWNSYSLNGGIIPKMLVTFNAGLSFDTKGLPATFTPVSSSTVLTNVGVGMRKKNLYITEVDVYLCGLNLSPNGLANIRNLPADGSIADAILKPLPARKGASANDYRASVTLKFVRNVGKDKIVSAFDDAFVGCNKDAIILFKLSLDKSLGGVDLNQNDTLEFYWIEGGGLRIAKNNVMREHIALPEIEKRLLEVYVDDKRTVSKDLVASIRSNVSTI